MLKGTKAVSELWKLRMLFEKSLTYLSKIQRQSTRPGYSFMFTRATANASALARTHQIPAALGTRLKAELLAVKFEYRTCLRDTQNSSPPSLTVKPKHGIPSNFVKKNCIHGTVRRKHLTLANTLLVQNTLH